MWYRVEERGDLEMQNIHDAPKWASGWPQNANGGLMALQRRR